MSHFKKFTAFFSFILFLNDHVLANEGKEESKPEQHEMISTESKAVTDFSGQQDEEWMVLQSDLISIKSKLDAQRITVNELLLSKKNNKGRIPKDQVDQLNDEYKKLKDLLKDYNKRLSLFEVKYPEKGQLAGRQYSRKKIQTLDQMESSLTLDGRVRKINKKINSQFKVEEKSDAADKPVSRLGDGKISQPAKPKADVTEKIIIVK